MKTTILFSLLSAISLSTLGQCNSPGQFHLISESLQPISSPGVIANLTYYFNPQPAARRVIFLVPGLNGDYNAWRDVRDETGGDTREYPSYPPRKAEMRMLGTKSGPGYSQDAGLASAAKDVWDYMSNINYSQLNTGPVTNNIAIGHSQGGLILRAVEYQQSLLNRPAYFGGMVTFGSPHQGAAILTNGLPVTLGGRGQLGSFINGFCSSLTDGPLQEKLQLSDNFFFQLIRLLNLDDQAVSFKNQLCGVLSDSILPHYILKDYTSTITQDYMAHDKNHNSPNYLLNTLNQHQAGIPAIAFYGVEEEPVFWRQLGSLRKKVHSYPAFQADPDQEFVDQYAKIMANYRAKNLVYQDKADEYAGYSKVACNPVFSLTPITLPISALLCTIYEGKRQRNQTVASAYERGFLFLIRANEKWKGIIGARETKVKQVGYLCECEHLNTGNLSQTKVASINQCAVGISYDPQGKKLCSAYPNIELIVRQFENDGVVLASSAKQLPGALVNPNLTELDYRLEKTNHQQMRNSSETAKKLKRLFDTPDYGYFFMTPRL